MLGRLYSIGLNGSTVPIEVVVPQDEDHFRERHAAVMFARGQAEPWQQHRTLTGCERGPLVWVLTEGGD
jgi:hypothetical protein